MMVGVDFGACQKEPKWSKRVPMREEKWRPAETWKIKKERKSREKRKGRKCCVYHTDLHFRIPKKEGFLET